MSNHEQAITRANSVGATVIATVRVPEDELQSDMTDEEIRQVILNRGEVDSVEEMAQSISPVREQIEGDS